MRRAGLAAVLVALVAGWWFVSAPDQLPPPSERAAPPPPAPPAAVQPERVATEPAPETEGEAPLLEPPPLALPTCRPRTEGDGPPLEVTFVGDGLPAAPPPATMLLVRWFDGPNPRRWFVELAAWRQPLWLCDESELSVTRGPWRLHQAKVPRRGAVTVRLEAAGEPSELAVSTVRPDGAPVDGVRLSISGCGPVLTTDGGVASVWCEGTELRSVVVRSPWRLARRVAVPPGARTLRVVVVGEEEVEPGRVGLGFSPRVPLEVGIVSKDGPAERGGVRVGDQLLEVDGAGVASEDEAAALIIGAPGTPVRLKVRRADQVLLLDLVRQP